MATFRLLAAADGPPPAAARRPPLAADRCRPPAAGGKSGWAILNEFRQAFKLKLLNAKRKQY